MKWAKKAYILYVSRHGGRETAVRGIPVRAGLGAHGSAKATKIELSCLNEIPLQMLPMGMWGPENMKIKNIC